MKDLFEIPSVNFTNNMIHNLTAQLLKQKQLLCIFLLGFVSGVPFLLTLSTLSFWLTESGVNKSIIGSFMLISLPYSFKFLWAPLMDHFKLPILTGCFGQRRGWALAMQAGLIIALWILGSTNPAESIWPTAISAFFVSFFSASQDIVIDAYRIEILAEQQRGTGAALETIGFRFGMLSSGAGALYLAALFDWQTAYHLMALCVVVGMVTVLMMPEPKSQKVISFPPNGMQKTSLLNKLRPLLWLPWQQLIQSRTLIPLLLFIFCFKMGDTVLNAMSAPFLCDLGYSKIEFASVSKVFGITLMVIGGLTGGYMIHQLGMIQSAVLCSILQAVSCLMFAIQSLVGYDCSVLMITVGTESFCSGLVSAVFIAYLSGFCCQPHTASQFTLLYSFGSLCRVITSAAAGWIADQTSWTLLFLLVSLALFPTLSLLSRISQQQEKNALQSSKKLSKIA
jgi:MFS transporter, PAT family, beta-lactamase induction signal transducer AmpG